MRVRHFDQVSQLILTNISQLTLFSTVFPVNCYLVAEEDGLTLVDTTISLGGPKIAQIIRQSPVPLRRIVATHAHFDHIGSLDYLKAAFPEVEVSIPQRSLPLVAGDMSLLDGEDPSPVRGRFISLDTVPDRTLVDGDMVGSLRVIASPGHSPDSVSFFDERSGALICGDAIQTRGGLAVSGDRRLLFPLVAVATWSRPLALASAKRLRELQPKLLMCGHGRVLENPDRPLAAVIARAETLFQSPAAGAAAAEPPVTPPAGD